MCVRYEIKQLLPVWGLKNSWRFVLTSSSSPTEALAPENKHISSLEIKFPFYLSQRIKKKEQSQAQTW